MIEFRGWAAVSGAAQIFICSGPLAVISIYFEASVEKGFNSDIIFKGMNFHVQSEDWGVENPYIVSRVYQSGAVIKSIKTSYSEVLGATRRSFGQRGDVQAIRLALREQHEKILDQLISGQLF